MSISQDTGLVGSLDVGTVEDSSRRNLDVSVPSMRHERVDVVEMLVMPSQLVIVPISGE
jgi:hypothetical protein